MEKFEPKTNKGQLMEENLRNYFLEMGYYVARGVKYTYRDSESTDIDLFLYNRPTILSRERINVDIKNKKSPQAMERIFVAKGLQSILKFDKCIVATKDCRESVKEFASLHNVIVLDGVLLSKLSNKINTLRYSEEELFFELNKDGFGKLSGDWLGVIEKMKSSLLSDYHYSGCIESLETTHYFIEQCLVNTLRKEAACRCMFLLLSIFLLKLDFILKDLAFLEIDIRFQKMADGFKYGNIGEAGVRKFIKIAQHIIPEKQSTSFNSQLKQIYDSIPASIIAEYFTKNDVSKNIFKNAKEFEFLAYSKEFKNPNQIDIELRSIISLTLDYFNIDRKTFFNHFR